MFKLMAKMEIIPKNIIHFKIVLRKRNSSFVLAFQILTTKKIIGATTKSNAYITA